MFDAKSQTVDKSHAMTFSILFISYDFFSIIIYGHTAFSKQRHFRPLSKLVNYLGVTSGLKKGGFFQSI